MWWQRPGACSTQRQRQGEAPSVWHREGAVIHREEIPGNVVSHRRVHQGEATRCIEDGQEVKWDDRRSLTPGFGNIVTLTSRGLNAWTTLGRFIISRHWETFQESMVSTPLYFLETGFWGRASTTLPLLRHHHHGRYLSQGDTKEICFIWATD